MGGANVSRCRGGKDLLPSRWDPCDTDDGLITTALLLAAGAGTRLQPLTDNSPKCLTEVRGIPILRRLLSCLVEEGFRRLVVVVGYRDAQIRDYLEQHPSGLVIDFVDCREYATTNNIYSLWRARKHIRESFVLIESDLVFDSRLLGQMRVWDRVAVAPILSPLLGTTVSINEFGRVLSFCVGSDSRTSELAHKTVNIYSLSKATWLEVVRRLDKRIAVGRVHDYYEVVFAEMVAEGVLELEAVHFDEGRWCEIDTLDDLRTAEQIFLDPEGVTGIACSESFVHPAGIMTAPRQATDQRIIAGETPPQLDYTRVRAYWKSARPSMLGPYMMDGFGLPVGAGSFRFRGETKAVAAAIKDLGPDTSVLDLGSGVGVWAEYFAQRFSNVVAVEASPTLFEALVDRCSRYPNLTTHNCDVLSFEPNDQSGSTDGFGLVFLGGLLMYLNDHDVATLLRKLVPHLRPGAIVLCRESTIRHGVNTLQGDYQVTYRSVETYRRILVDAGFDIVNVKANTAYINAQMACELIKKWKAVVPERLHCLPIVGRLAYWGLRLGYPWNTRLIPWMFARMGHEFPLLTNHFFVLQPSPRAAADRRDAPSHGTQFVQERFQKAR